MAEPQPWHRLFGLSLIDFLRSLPVTVELEKDLSLKQQFLDVILIRKGTEPLARRLPDGFDLAAHNLITFKSYRETLDGWALNELVGHYVNYRKQVSPSMRDLLPEADFRLFAVCVRSPRELADDVPLTPVMPGVFEARHFSGTLRVVVVHELPQEEQNALLHLFSARRDLVQYGRFHFKQRSEETSTLLLQLFRRYRLENDLMPDLLEEFARETIRELLQELPAEKRLEGLSAEERLEGLSAEERLEGLPAEKRLEGLPAEKRLEGLSPDELLAALSPEVREALTRRIRDAATGPKGEPNEPA